MENIEKRLGSVVKSLRQAAGMTQEKLAQQMTAEGIPTKQNTIAKLEGGLRPTTVPEFGTLARIFNCSAADLADAVFPEASSGANKAGMRSELSDLRKRLQELYSNFESLQFITADVRSELMEHEMRSALLEARIGDLDTDGTPMAKPRGKELDKEVHKILNTYKGLLSGEHPEEA